MDSELIFFFKENIEALKYLDVFELSAIEKKNLSQITFQEIAEEIL